MDCIEQLQKQKKLLEFLELAIKEYEQGNNVKINKIIEEVCSKKKNIESLQLWMKCFQKVLTQICANKRTWTFVVEIVMIKMPWFSNSQNHIAIINLYETFLMAVISFDISYIKIVYRSLVQQILPGEISVVTEQKKKTETPFQIANQSFSNKFQLLHQVKDIMAKYSKQITTEQPRARLEAQDQDLLRELFKYHPRSAEKLKNLSCISVGNATFNSRTASVFYIEKKNDEIEDISYMKCINNLADHAYETAQLKLGSKEYMIETYSAITKILCKINKIYPLYQKYLIEMISEFYPHRLQGEEYHKIYMIAILKLALMDQKMSAPILGIILDKLVSIDAEIKIQASVATQQQHQKSAQESGSRQVPGVQTSLQMNQLSECEQRLEEASKVNEEFIDQMARKLDWLMLILFEYFDCQFNLPSGSSLPKKIFTEYNNGQCSQKPASAQSGPNSENVKFFKQMIQIFKNKILIANQLKFVQFTFFYICSISHAYAETFLATLISNIFYSENIIYSKMVIEYIQYLASFLARAKFVEAEQLESVLSKQIIDYLRQFIKVNSDIQFQKLSQEELLKQNMIFYQLIQATMYIMIFCRDKLKLSTIQQVTELLDSIFKSDFQPLEFINQRILYEFMTMCRDLQIKGAPETILHALTAPKPPKRLTLSQQFPFDPYLLEFSSKYIANIYRSWNQAQEEEEQAHTKQQPSKTGQIKYSYDSNLENEKDDQGYTKNQYNCSTTLSEELVSREQYTPSEFTEENRSRSGLNGIKAQGEGGQPIQMQAAKMMKRIQKPDLLAEESDSKKKVKAK